jgi:hypothetical protein
MGLKVEMDLGEGEGERRESKVMLFRRCFETHLFRLFFFSLVGFFLKGYENFELHCIPSCLFFLTKKTFTLLEEVCEANLADYITTMLE